MKQYRIEINYFPRRSLDRWPWTWTVVDENYQNIENNQKIMIINREKTSARARRKAQRHTRKLVKEYNRASNSKNESYLYPNE